MKCEVVPAVVEILAYAAAHLHMIVASDCDIAGIEKPVHVRSKEDSVFHGMGTAGAEEIRA